MVFPKKIVESIPQHHGDLWWLIYDSLIFAARSQGPKAPKSQAVLVTTWFAPRATAPFMVEPEKTLGDDTRRFHSLSQEMIDDGWCTVNLVIIFIIYIENKMKLGKTWSRKKCWLLDHVTVNVVGFIWTPSPRWKKNKHTDTMGQTNGSHGQPCLCANIKGGFGCIMMQLAHEKQTWDEFVSQNLLPGTQLCWSVEG